MPLYSPPTTGKSCLKIRTERPSLGVAVLVAGLSPTPLSTPPGARLLPMVGRLKEHCARKQQPQRYRGAGHPRKDSVFLCIDALETVCFSTFQVQPGGKDRALTVQSVISPNQDIQDLSQRCSAVQR